MSKSKIQKNSKTLNKQAHIKIGNIIKMKFINWNKGKTWAHNSIEELQHICSEENPSIFSIHEFNHKKEDDNR